MGQIFLKRSHFLAIETIVDPKNDDRQDVAFTGYFEVGDIVDIVDVDVNGNILSTLADNLTILSISTDDFVVLSAVVDTTLATGTPKIVCQEIDDGQDAVDRLYRRKLAAKISFDRQEPILAQALDTPSLGQATYYVADSSFYAVGDTIDILADEGIVATGATILAVVIAADDTNNQSYIVLDTSADISTFTNPLLVNTSLTHEDAIIRNQEAIDMIDLPIENEYIGVGDGSFTVFDCDSLFIAGSSKLYVDGKRLRLGTAGTRAVLTQGAGNSQLIYTSQILGTKGNATKVAVVAGAGLTISITGNFNAGYNISINDNGGAATSQDIADALNAHAVAKRLVLVQYGGDGSGLVAAFALTNLAGGLNDGIGDYAEIEQVYNNFIVNTGNKWFSLHIRPNERNRLNTPPRDDEELVVDYRTPLSNQDR